MAPASIRPWRAEGLSFGRTETGHGLCHVNPLGHPKLHEICTSHLCPHFLAAGRSPRGGRLVRHRPGRVCRGRRPHHRHLATGTVEGADDVGARGHRCHRVPRRGRRQRLGGRRLHVDGRRRPLRHRRPVRTMPTGSSSNDDTGTGTSPESTTVPTTVETANDIAVVAGLSHPRSRCSAHHLGAHRWQRDRHRPRWRRRPPRGGPGHRVPAPGTTSGRTSGTPTPTTMATTTSATSTPGNTGSRYDDLNDEETGYLQEFYDDATTVESGQGRRRHHGSHHARHRRQAHHARMVIDHRHRDRHRPRQR